MKHITALVTLISTLVLTACGGGGGGGAPGTPAVATDAQPFTCVSQLQGSAGKYRAAVFDTRRDEPSYTAQGLQTTSFEATKLMIDRARCVGFDTIIFDVNVPLDPATGLIVLETSTENYRIPTDFWKYINYAKSLGITVAVRPIPVDYHDDETIQSNDNVPVDQFFASVKSFIVPLAEQSNRNNVDFFFVGSYQSGLDAAQYDTQWTDIVNSVKAVYSKKITYATCDICDNIVWSKVDFVTVGMGTASTIIAVADRYQRPVLIDGVAFDSVTPSGHTSMLWQSVLSNSLVSATPNYELQQQKINSFFALVENDFRGRIMGFGIGAYLPWLQDRYIQTPTHPLDQMFKLFDNLGYSLYNNVSAQKTIQDHLSKPWN